MKTSKTRPAFSAIKIIITVVVVAGLGVGGYFAYVNYIAPMLNPYSKIVPEGLRAYDVGKNADAFFIYKIDNDLKSLIATEPAAAQAALIDSVMGFYSSSQQSGVVILHAQTSDVAQLVQNAIESVKPKPGQFSMTPSFDVERKDNVIIISLGKGLQAFQGPLAENPDIKNIDPSLIDSQLIVELNHEKTPEATMLAYAAISTILGGISMSEQAMIPTAHAQGLISHSDNPAAIPLTTSSNSTASELSKLSGLLSFAKNTTILARYKNGALEVHYKTSLIAKEDIGTSGLLNLMKMMGGNNPNIPDLETAYDETINSVDKFTPQIQNWLKQIKQTLPASDATFAFDKKSVAFTVTIPASDVEILKQKEKESIEMAPKKARNAARKADLRILQSALETYNTDNSKYPQESNCTEKMPDLEKYLHSSIDMFTGKTIEQHIPADTQGTQTIGAIECSSGYYYQYLPNQGYILWAKTELDAGNTNETPDTISTKINDPGFSDALRKGTTGQYFIIDQVDPLKVSSASQESVIAPTVVTKPKVKRTN